MAALTLISIIAVGLSFWCARATSSRLHDVDVQQARAGATHRAKWADVARLRTELEGARRSAAAATEDVNSLTERLRNEVWGVTSAGTTGIAGFGPLARMIQQSLDDAVMLSDAASSRATAVFSTYGNALKDAQGYDAHVLQPSQAHLAALMAESKALILVSLLLALVGVPMTASGANGVVVASQVLPKARRARFLEECASELAELPVLERFGYGARVLAGSLSLRLTMRGDRRRHGDGR